MKSPLHFTLAVLALSSGLHADQIIHFPKQDAKISITFADSWKFQKGDENALYAQSTLPADETADLSLIPLAAGTRELALTEAMAILAIDYSNLKFEKPAKPMMAGIDSVIFKATGVDSDDGDIHLNGALFRPAAGGPFFMLFLVCGPAEAKRHDKDIITILGSISKD